MDCRVQIDGQSRVAQCVELGWQLGSGKGELPVFQETPARDETQCCPNLLDASIMVAALHHGTRDLEGLAGLLLLASWRPQTAT
jgi:hypothetical protein